MMHFKASRLIAALPDATLPEDVELDVRVHVASCARCRRKLEEIEISEELMRGIPHAILPLEWSPRSYRRLDSLARWSSEPDLPDPVRWRLPMLSVVSAVAILTIAVMAGRYSPFVDHDLAPIHLATYAQDVAYTHSHLH
jgi:anti-sigma factor RsiW